MYHKYWKSELLISQTAFARVAPLHSRPEAVLMYHRGLSGGRHDEDTFDWVYPPEKRRVAGRTA